MLLFDGSVHTQRSRDSDFDLLSVSLSLTPKTPKMTLSVYLLKPSLTL